LAVDQPKVVDLIGVDIATGEVVLTISDHLDWRDGQEHLLALQEKLNTYLAFVESGELVESYPEAKERAVGIKVLFKFRPDRLGLQFLEGAKEAIQSAGFSFRHEVFAESYGN
jgi:hypothetical protein